MAIRPGLCHAGKLGFLTGVHQPKDIYRLALYGADADLSPKTAMYGARGEVSGQGYTPGGITLNGYDSGVTEAGVAWVNWTILIVLRNSTIRARGALLYNASKGNQAIEVIDFGTEYAAINGVFEIEMPASGVTSLVTFE
jgi:hypothetical protein